MGTNTPDDPGKHKSGLAHFKISILAGLAALMPLALTILVLYFIWGFIDDNIVKNINNAAQTYLRTEPGKRMLRTQFDWSEEVLSDRELLRQKIDEEYPKNLGVIAALLISLLFLYFLGFFVRSYVGKKLYERLEGMFLQLPIVKKIYPHAQRVTSFVFGTGPGKNFRRVVAVEYPRKGLYALGFVTGEGLQEVVDVADRSMLNVFVPTSPAPVTGFVLFVPDDEVVSLPLTVDQALGFLTTCGAGSYAAKQEKSPNGVPAPMPEIPEPPEDCPSAETPGKPTNINDTPNRRENGNADEETACDTDNEHGDGRQSVDGM